MIDTWEVSPVMCVSDIHTCMCACIHLKCACACACMCACIHLNCACACACMSLSRFLSLRLRLRLFLFLCVRFGNTGMCTYRSSLEAHRLMCLMSAKESECLPSLSLTPISIFRTTLLTSPNPRSFTRSLFRLIFCESLRGSL